MRIPSVLLVASLLACPSCSAKRSIAASTEEAHAASQRIAAHAARGDASLAALQPSLDEEQAPLAISARKSFSAISSEAVTVEESTHEIAEALPGVTDIGWGIVGWIKRIGILVLGIAIIAGLIVAFGPTLASIGVPGITWLLKRLWATGAAIPRSIRKAVEDTHAEFTEVSKATDSGEQLSPDAVALLSKITDERKKSPAFDAAWQRKVSGKPTKTRRNKRK